MENVDTAVFSAFKTTLSLSDNVDTADLIYNEYPGWDSVAHMALVAALEEKFDCMLDMDDILDLSSYDKAIEIMRKHV